MSRTVGARNRDHEQRREALAFGLVPAVLGPGGAAVSLRELATVAGVSVPTLRHYFGDRAGAVRAAMGAMGRMGDPHVERGASEPHGEVRESMEWFVGQVLLGWELGLGPMLSAAFAAGMADRAVGPAFIDDILEPLLQSAERRLADHVGRGEIAIADLRGAALALMGPIVLALLHQGPLGGGGCRPLDVAAFARSHLEGFFRMHPPC